MADRIYPIFSKPIYESRLNVPNAKMAYVLNFLKNNNYANYKNSIKLDIGTKTNYVLDIDKFKFLKNAILQKFNLYAKQELKHNNKWQITTSWFAKTENGEEGNYHIHENSFYSGVFYLSTPNNCGDISFINFASRNLALTYTDYNILNSRKWSINPQEQNILFFPSDVYHKIEQNNSGKSRYSLSFNIMPKGTIQEANMSDTIITLGNVNE